jgi:hypothetical protein
MNRLRPIEECVRIWSDIIPPDHPVVWKLPEGKPGTSLIFAGSLLRGVNESLVERKLTPITVNELVDIDIRRVVVSDEVLEVTYIVLFEIPNMNDRVANAETSTDGKNFPNILYRKMMETPDTVVKFTVTLYPFLEYEGDLIPAFYRMDILHTMKHTMGSGQAYIAMLLSRARLEIRVGEFLKPSALSPRYMDAEDRANLVIKGEGRVAGQICGICRRASLKACASCLAPYCSRECQKRDWVKGHKAVCQQ